MNTYISWSGGKDSTATIILAHELGIKIDGIFISEVMFDNAKGISGENPKHIEWIKNIAIPRIEKDFGYSVTILHAKSDYVSEFQKQITSKSLKKYRIGKLVGFPLGGMCYVNNRLKMKPIREYRKKLGEHIEYVGIAIDEPKRLKRMEQKKHCISLLADKKMTEQDAYALCKKYDLLSPIYLTCRRGGCWFCPNQSLNEMANFAKEYPSIWQELEELNKLPNKVSDGFKYGRTFDSCNREINTLINQVSIFDFSEV